MGLAVYERRLESQDPVVVWFLQWDMEGMYYKEGRKKYLLKQTISFNRVIKNPVKDVQNLYMDSLC